MITTAELQGLTAPILEQVFAALGHDLIIVYTQNGEAWNTTPVPDTYPAPVRGFLHPAPDNAKRTAAASGLPVPAFEAYVPFDAADLSIPAFYIRCAGQNYYPTADARNEENQNIVWIVPLGSPGEVTARDGESEPGWTANPAP